MGQKPIAFLGDSLDKVRNFPASARRAIGYQLDRIQRGLEADDFKMLPSVGKGVEEIRVKDATGAYRVIYIARLSKAEVRNRTDQGALGRTSAGQMRWVL